jgi:hypothetical protein
MKYLSYKVIDKGGKPYIKIQTTAGEKNLSPEEVSAMVLVKMKEVAEAYLVRRLSTQLSLSQHTSTMLRDKPLKMLVSLLDSMFSESSTNPQPLPLLTAWTRNQEKRISSYSI